MKSTREARLFLRFPADFPPLQACGATGKCSLSRFLRWRLKQELLHDR
jgi:hypothetical protein